MIVLKIAVFKRVFYLFKFSMVIRAQLIKHYFLRVGIK